MDMIFSYKTYNGESYIQLDKKKLQDFIYYLKGIHYFVNTIDIRSADGKLVTNMATTRGDYSIISARFVLGSVPKSVHIRKKYRIKELLDMVGSFADSDDSSCRIFFIMWGDD